MSPVRWLKTELTLWALLIISALAFTGLVLLAWEHQDVRVFAGVVVLSVALTAFFVYGSKDLD